MTVSLNRQLIGAATNGCLDKVEKLLEQGADIHTADEDGSPDAVMHGAACLGHLDVVRFLHKNGADIYARNDWAVRVAARNGHLDVVRFLFDKGANISAFNDAAMRGAAENGHLDVVRFLHPLRLVRTPDEVLNRRLARTNLGQSENGADIRAQNNAAMCGAAQNGHLDVVHFLAENGVDIRAFNDVAVRLAAWNGQLDVVRFLVNPRKYRVDREGCDRNILAQKYHKILVQIQQLEQQELYQNARVMYYALSFAQQNQYTKGSCGALVQALDSNL